MIKLQQEQLTQLTKSITQLREIPRGSHPSRSDFVVCRRCQRRGHFARECNWERVFPPPDRTDTRVPEGRQRDGERVFSCSPQPNQLEREQRRSH